MKDISFYEAAKKKIPSEWQKCIQKITILQEKCSICESEIVCVFAVDVMPSDYYFYSAHFCLNPSCSYYESANDKTGNLGGGPNVDCANCLICNRYLYKEEVNKKRDNDSLLKSEVCVTVECNCPFSPDYKYYPKDMIGIHRTKKNDPRVNINSNWDLSGGCMGLHYSQDCEEEQCNPFGKIVQIIESCYNCPYQYEKICPLQPFRV